MSAYSRPSSAAASSFAPTSTGSCPTFNCSTASALKPNPDISGIGVLLGFVTSTYLTLFFCAAYYCINIEGASNPVDHLFLERFSPKSFRKISKKWSDALQTAVLTLGDSQVVTGISILVSGYIQLACGLQYYHWLIVVDLAFFSSVTHLTTLTCLRSYFQKRPAVRAWRLVSMGVTSVLLAVALQSTGYDDPGHDWPAQCFLTHKLGHFEGTADSGTYRYDSLYVAIVLCFLSLSYVSRVVQLFPSTQVIMRNHFRSRPSNLFRAWLVRVGDCATLSSRKSTRDSSHLVHMLLLSIYCLLKAVLDLYGSLLWEITWLALASAWGMIVIWRDRTSGDSGDGLSIAEQVSLSEDNTWRFGQIFPLLLLILPLVSFFEAFYEKMASPTKTPSPFQQGLGITFPTPTPQQSSGSTHAASLPVSDGLSTVLPVQSQAQPYNDPYQYPWFTKLIILIYGITLSLAGIVLWILPYSGFSTKSIGYITFAFVPWFAYNSGMLLIFALVSLHLSHKRSSGSTSPSKLHGGRPVRYKWTGPIARNAILVAMLGSSCAIGVVIFNNV